MDILDLKRVIIETLRLPFQPEEIIDDAPLVNKSDRFYERKEGEIDPQKGLELDSIDIIELVTGLEATYKVTIPDVDMAKENFASVNALKKYLEGKINGIS